MAAQYSSQTQSKRVRPSPIESQITRLLHSPFMSFLSVAGASQIYFHYCILSSSSEDLAIKKRQPQQHPKKTKKKKSGPRGWSVTVKHATRCISEQATGKISVIWLSLVTQFTLVLHEERKKEERGKKKKNPSLEIWPLQAERNQICSFVQISAELCESYSCANSVQV